MSKYILKSLANLKSIRSVCGFRKDLLTSSETDGKFNFEYIYIDNSSKHYHKATTEIYYCLGGKGKLELDGEVVELEAGTMVMIPPGIKHTADGENLELLIFGIPAIDMKDVYFN